VAGLVASLGDQFLLGTELHEPRGLERHALDLVHRVVGLLLRPTGDATARLPAETRPSAIDGSDVAAQDPGDGRRGIAVVPHLLQLPPAYRSPGDARLNIGVFVKILHGAVDFSLLNRSPFGRLR